MNLQTVVVGLDLTAPSMIAARWVANHFAPEARLILVHSIEERWLPDFLLRSDYERLRDANRARASRALQSFGREIGAERTRTLLKRGRPARMLAETATEKKADLVVVGAHRRRPVAGSVLGSTASQLLGVSQTPVLVAHGLPPAKPRHLLAAVDESAHRSRVLQWAGGLAESFDAPGHVVFAVEPPGVDVSTTLFSSAREYREARARIMEKAENWLGGVVRDEELDSERFRTSVAYGRPELEIVATADRLGSELIVTGTRGRGRAHAIAVGSVARGVLENSGCPVLVIPPERG